MQKRKLSTSKIMFAVCSFMMIACIAIALPLTMSNEKVANVDAISSSVSVTFAGFPSNSSIKPFCVADFVTSEGVMSHTILKANGSFAVSGTGKLEITIPMYCTITSGLPTSYVQNGTTYYIDSGASLSAITITFNDRGYFGSTTILS